MGGTSSQEVEQAESKKATHSTTVQRRPVTTRWGIRLCGKSMYQSIANRVSSVQDSTCMKDSAYRDTV